MTTPETENATPSVDWKQIAHSHGREIARLREALKRYANCRHATVDCFCTLEARAALYVPEAER